MPFHTRQAPNSLFNQFGGEDFFGQLFGGSPNTSGIIGRDESGPFVGIDPGSTRLNEAVDQGILDQGRKETRQGGRITGFDFDNLRATQAGEILQGFFDEFLITQSAAIEDAIRTLRARSEDAEKGFNETIAKIEGRVAEDRLDEGEIQNRITSAEDSLSRDLRGELGSEASRLSRSGLQGGALTGGVAAQAITRSSADRLTKTQDIRVDADKFNEEISSAAETLTAQLDITRESLITNLSTAQAILERGDITDPALQQSMFFDVLSFDESITQARNILEFAEENRDSINPDLYEKILSGLSDFANLTGFERGGLALDFLSDF